MNTLQKLIATSFFAIGTTTASATQFYIDNGINYAPDTMLPTKVNPTSTSLKDQLTFKYQSSTDIDFGADNVLSIGDTVTTSGGLAVGSSSANNVTSLNPNETIGGGGYADNGYNDDWALSFSFNNLTGTVVGFQGTFPLLQYTSGTIDFLYTIDGLSFNNFMDLVVTGSSLTGGANLGLTGYIDFANVDPGFNDLFRTANGDSFYSLWNNVPPLEVSFIIDQNTDPNAATISNITNGINISSDHDGSINFNVPEPSTVALLGLSLLGLGFRKKA